MLRVSSGFRVVLVFVLLFAVSGLGSAQSKAAKIDALMQLVHENGQFNGSVLVAENGKVIFKKGYGLANMEWGIPNAPDTKFRLGSITKQFTAMLTLQLVQQGKLKLDGKITDYLPDYPRATGDRITIHQLLTHSSGIPGYTEFPGFFQTMSRDPYTPREFVKQFADSALLFEPGTRYRYSNSGYFLLGVIIENVTGMTYEEALQRFVLDPAGMKNTGYDRSAPILARRASGYERNPLGVTNAPYLDMSLPYAAGSLYSTVEDLYLWDQALYTDKLLSNELKGEMFKAQVRMNPVMSYGYGWMTGNSPVGRSADTVEVVLHGGGINGFNTVISRVPKDRHLVVMLNNTGGTRLNEMNRAILGILYDKPYDPPMRSLAEEFVKDLVKSGEKKAKESFRERKKNQGDVFMTNEREVNNVGYQLLRMGKVDEAIAVFRLNVEEYPESSNVYDSLGEAYMIAGKKDLAIENYRKSVELDPGNTGGKEALKKLQAQ